MTVDYTFAPILLDASPIPSRFVAPLDSPTGGVWLESRPVASVPVSWDRGQSIMAIVIGGHLYVGPEIRAGGRSEAEEIAARLSYGGQPVTVDGFLVEEFPAALADPARRAEIKGAIAAEVRRAIDGGPRE